MLGWMKLDRLSVAHFSEFNQSNVFNFLRGSVGASVTQMLSIDDKSDCFPLQLED